MKLMIDTNILLDVLLQRNPFFNNSRAVLKLCEDHAVSGFVSDSAVTDIFYKAEQQSTTSIGASAPHGCG